MRTTWKRNVAEGVGLVLVLAFVFLMAFVPHLKTPAEPMAESGPPVWNLAVSGYEYAAGDRVGYPYALHVDEHLHWVYMASIQRQERVDVDDPYTGTPPARDSVFSLRGTVHERGFQSALAEVQAITGVGFHHIFHYLPALWMVFTAFAMYALLRPGAAALPAAAFVGLIPTTVRFMGPSFLVPIGFVLAWLPVVLILKDPARKRFGAAALLFAVVVWAFFIHLIGGFAAVGLLLLAVVLGARRDRRQVLTMLLVSLVPVAWLYRTFTRDVQGEWLREENLPIDFTIFDGFGIPALFAWMAGVGLVALLPPRRGRQTVVVLTAFSVLALAMILGTVAFGWGRYATYARWHPPFFLAAAVPLGHLVAVACRTLAAAVARAPRPAWTPKAAPALAVVLGLFLVPAIASQGIDGHAKEPYYRVLRDEDWAAFNAAAAHAGPEYEVFLSHPWKAPFVTALTGKHPHTVMLPGGPPGKGEDWTWFAQTGGSLAFFILNDITLVFSTAKPPFDEFVEVGPGVWGLRPDIAREIAEVRSLERGH